ncbi:MAG: DMT family transporter [Ancalomicrobiaceae bacterium]|nr:DMT family transporter [Ancalomicrobiaceae bacterium]
MFESLATTYGIPSLFVLIWSTGWVVVLFVTPHADPLTFLVVRFVLAGGLMALIAWRFGAHLPKNPRYILHAIGSGLFLHGFYLAGIWWALGQGVPTGLSALIAALQPLMTAAVAPFLLNERLSGARILGIVLGFAGLVVALSPKLAGLDPAHLWTSLGPILVNVVAMVSVTGGTFYQKAALHGGDLRVTASLQYLGALIVALPLAFVLEPMRLTWTLETALAMAWSVLGLSIGAISLLLMLIRRGDVSRAATLIYLVPPTAALQAWLVKGIVMTPIELAGMAITIAGVALASRR